MSRQWLSLYAMSISSNVWTTIAMIMVVVSLVVYAYWVEGVACESLYYHVTTFASNIGFRIISGM